jgi:hypothetical protein
VLSLLPTQGFTDYGAPNNFRVELLGMDGPTFAALIGRPDDPQVGTDGHRRFHWASQVRVYKVATVSTWLVRWKSLAELYLLTSYPVRHLCDRQVKLGKGCRMLLSEQMTFAWINRRPFSLSVSPGLAAADAGQEGRLVLVRCGDSRPLRPLTVRPRAAPLGRQRPVLGTYPLTSPGACQDARGTSTVYYMYLPPTALSVLFRVQRRDGPAPAQGHSLRPGALHVRGVHLSLPGPL